MDYRSIDEIYAANARFRDDFFKAIDALTATEITALPRGEKWSIEQIAEHVSIVDEGMLKICRKLLNEAKVAGLPASGVSVSNAFRESIKNLGTTKLEAPERVQPGGEQSLADSRARIVENKAWLEQIQTLFNEFDGTQAKFPHPYFGPLSAEEWLILAGQHMCRHTGQIQKLVEKIRQ